MRKIKLTALALGITTLMMAQAPKVYYVDLKEGQEVSGQPIKESTLKATKDYGKRLVLYPEIEFQTIEGFGGAFNEIGGEALMSLPESAREEVMKNLFSKEGSGFTMCRTAVGASDFGIDAYSYSEVAEDYKMKKFSIERERSTVLPYIKTALKYNPDLSIFASPWSPPGWMKHSGYMDRGVEFPEKNHLKDDAKIYEAYALYFAKYVKAYAKEGIDVDRIIIQNEQDVHTKYPSCVMPPKQMAKLAGEYMQPLFEKKKIDAEIWAGSFRTADQFDGIEFVANEEYRSTVDGIGIQYTKSYYTDDMWKAYPEMRLMHTEGACYNGKNEVAQAKRRLEEVANFINYGTPNYCYWNMILNETTESGWEWKQNSLINIDRQTQKVTYNPDYAVMSLMGKYIQPGTKRFASFSRSTLISVADADKMYVYLQNDSKNPDTYEVWKSGEKVAVVAIPAQSLAVVVFDK